MSNKQKTGFTLIELLVVIAIVGLLAAVIATSLSGTRGKARDAKRAEELRQLALAMELYYLEHGEYPYWTGSGSDEGVCTEEGDGKTNLEAALVDEYIAALPEDPNYSSINCGYDGETTYPSNPECSCVAYKTNTAKQYKALVKMEENTELAEEDGGIYSAVYEIYSEQEGAKEIAIDYGTTTIVCAVDVTCGFAAGSACINERCDSCTSPMQNCIMSMPGCETDTSNDTANCGNCGYACAPSQICSSGVCTNVNTYLLYLFKNIAAGGIVISNPAGISCATSCANTSASFASGTSVTLTATESTDYNFSGWSGYCTSTSTFCTIMMNAATSVIANFILE